MPLRWSWQIMRMRIRCAAVCTQATFTGSLESPLSPTLRKSWGGESFIFFSLHHFTFQKIVWQIKEVAGIPHLPTTPSPWLSPSTQHSGGFSWFVRKGYWVNAALLELPWSPCLSWAGIPFHGQSTGQVGLSHNYHDLRHANRHLGLGTVPWNPYPWLTRQTFSLFSSFLPATLHRKGRRERLTHWQSTTQAPDSRSLWDPTLLSAPC